MKKILSISSLCWAIIMMTSNGLFAQQQGFVIEGQLKGLKDGTRISLLTAVERKEAYLRVNEIKDSTVAELVTKHGAFRFDGYIPNPARVYKIVIEGQDRNLILVMLNETVTIKGDLFDWPRVEVTNCTYFKERREVERELTLIKNKFPVSGLVPLGGPDALNEAYRNYIAGFSGKRLNSVYIPYLILLHDFSTDEKQAFYDKFSASVKNSYYGLKLKAQIEFLKDLEKIKEKAVIPPFNLITSEGAHVSILDLAKKSDYTLLYFWFKDGSPAWKPDLIAFKKIAEKLKQQGINLVNVNIDGQPEDWKTGMQEFDAPGLHVRFEKESSDKSLFDLQFTPSQILIDKEGRLISFQLAGSRAKSFGLPLGARALAQTLTDLQTSSRN